MQAEIITISQQKGGCGKTTITIQLAVSLGQQGSKVAIVDTDPQASLTKWYNIREAKFGKNHTNITFVSTSGWRLHNCIHELSYNHDYIFIDSPPHTEADAKAAIRISNLVLIPLQPSPTDVWAITPTISICTKENKDFKIIFNRITNHNKFLKELSEEFKGNLLINGLRNRIAYSNCLIKGEGVTETDPKSLASQEVMNLIKEIQDLLVNIKEYS